MKWVYENLDQTKQEKIEFCVVRPSDLKNGDQCPYEAHNTLQNGAFDGPGTHRANVGDFIANCVTDEKIWGQYKNQYPHIVDVIEKKPSRGAH